MSKPSRRPNREKIKAENKQYKKAQRKLFQDEKVKGLQKPSHGTIFNCYPITIDGTGKFKRNWLWEEECLERNIKKEDEIKKQYHVYVLEANLAFCDGMTIPLMSEILSYTKGDSGNDKQDCELKAFYRLASRLKKAFPALKIMVLLDGLYAKGPVAEICRKNKWQFMIVLKDGALPSVMKEFEALSGLEKEKLHQHTWGNRKQVFRWVNGIDYRFESNDKKCQILHVVECQESWNEVDRESGKTEKKNSRHVWLSSEPLNKFNLHERGNHAKIPNTISRARTEELRPESRKFFCWVRFEYLKDAFWN